MFDIGKLPVTNVDEWNGSLVVVEYNEVTNSGKVLEYGLSQTQAQSKADIFNMVYCDYTFTVINKEDKPTQPTPIEVSNYCSKCGNTGYTADNEVCDCKFNPDTFFSTVSCLTVPEQYRGLVFNVALLPNDVDNTYKELLQNLYTNISTLRLKNHNYLLCSPHKHGKTVLAYTCIERLFKAGIDIMEMCDVMELRQIVSNSNSTNVLTSPYLFVRIPMYPNWEVFDTMNTILSRRVRSGTSTIFLYSGKYSSLEASDRQGYLISTRGDGSFGTLDVKEWLPRREFDAVDNDNKTFG